MVSIYWLLLNFCIWLFNASSTHTLPELSTKMLRGSF